MDFRAEVIHYAITKGAKNALSLQPMGEEAGESLPLDRRTAIKGLDIFGSNHYWFLNHMERYVS